MVANYAIFIKRESLLGIDLIINICGKRRDNPRFLVSAVATGDSTLRFEKSRRAIARKRNSTEELRSEREEAENLVMAYDIIQSNSRGT